MAASLIIKFLNRIDEKIMFLPLTKEEIKIIAGFMLKKVHKNLARQELSIELSESAKDRIRPTVRSTTTEKGDRKASGESAG